METSRIDLPRRLAELRAFFNDELWEARLDSLPKGKARGYRVLRVVYCALQGLFVSDTLHVRSAALTYFTVLSLVPLLAFAFAILKGFGAYDALVENTLRPYLLHTFEGNAALQQAVEHILIFVEDTGVTSLGFFGLLALLYAATRLLRNIEEALNQIWGAPHARGPLRQITDYAAIIMVTPLCLLLAAGLGTMTQLITALRSVQERLGVGSMLDWMVGIAGPFFVITIGLLFLYEVMPNTSVRLRSAAVGALVGGVLWYGMLILHVKFQVGVARYNALYSSFGVIPIFLVWIYVSWLVVLVGAQVAASHQQERTLARTARRAAQDQTLREAVALSALLRVARAFVSAQPPPTLQQLSEELDTPELLTGELLDAIEHAGLVIKTGTSPDARVVLGRMPEQILVKHVLDALRTPREPRVHLAPFVDPTAARLLAALDRELEHSPLNRSLRELLADAPPEVGRVGGERAEVHH